MQKLTEKEVEVALNDIRSGIQKAREGLDAIIMSSDECIGANALSNALITANEQFWAFMNKRNQKILGKLLREQREKDHNGN